MKKILFVFSCILLFSLNSKISTGEHAVKVINNTDSDVSLLISVPSYFKSYSMEEVSINKNTIYKNSFGDSVLASSYFAMVRYDDEKKVSRSKSVQYYNFLDDTLKIVIDNNGVSFSSEKGYDKALDYSPVHIKNVIGVGTMGFSNYIDALDDKLNERIAAINEYGFKSQKMRDYLINAEKPTFQTGHNHYLDVD